MNNIVFSSNPDVIKGTRSARVVTILKMSQKRFLKRFLSVQSAACCKEISYHYFLSLSSFQPYLLATNSWLHGLKSFKDLFWDIFKIVAPNADLVPLMTSGLGLNTRLFTHLLFYIFSHWIKNFCQKSNNSTINSIPSGDHLRIIPSHLFDK